MAEEGKESVKYPELSRILTAKEISKLPLDVRLEREREAAQVYRFREQNQAAVKEMLRRLTEMGINGRAQSFRNRKSRQALEKLEKDLREIVEAFENRRKMEEITLQNRELQEENEELEKLNQELEEKNRKLAAGIEYLCA